MSRLAATDPDLATALGLTSEQERLRLAVAAADMVLAETGQSPPRDPEMLPLSIEALDSAAWDLQKRGSQDYQAAFARARAVSALLFALRGEVDEAVYEALHATQDPDGIRGLVLDS